MCIAVHLISLKTLGCSLFRDKSIVCVHHCKAVVTFISKGGLSGAVGKVSGVLGDAAAKLTMDEEYQEKRRRRTGGSDSVRRGVEGAAKVDEVQ